MSYYDRALAELEQEADQIFEEIIALKRQIWQMIGPFVADEHEWQIFVRAHDSEMQEVEIRRARLKRQLDNRKHALQLLNMKLPDSLKNWQNPAGMTATPGASGGQEKPPVTGSASHAGPQRATDEINLGALEGLHADDPNLAPTSAEPPTPNPKSELARTFRQLYFPRSMQAEQYQFLEERARLINELVDGKDHDEVDFMLRLPFDAEDEVIWEQLRHQGGRAKVGKRWQEFRVWRQLLHEATGRAESLLASRPKALQAAFIQWKRSREPLAKFLGELKRTQHEELRTIETELVKVQAEIDQRQP